MIKAPNHTWLYTGSWPFSVFGVLPVDIESAYSGFKFEGEGWYPKWRFFIEATGETRNGQMTYQVSKYDRDPREMFLNAAALMTRGK